VFCGRDLEGSSRVSLGCAMYDSPVSGDCSRRGYAMRLLSISSMGFVDQPIEYKCERRAQLNHVVRLTAWYFQGGKS
jgi:hypothetical protein